MAHKKIHNSSRAMPAKVALRRNVLAAIPDARVFDAFCGPDGEMYRQVWRNAKSYVGCDTEWKPSDERLRFVGDNRVVMRAIDLSAYNVFDLDAFGSPWHQMAILAARRTWAPGEVGAVVLTDGSTMHPKFGGTSGGLRAIGNMPIGRGQQQADRLHDFALRTWIANQGLEPLHFWRAEGIANAAGAMKMRYLAVVFTRRAAGAASSRPS